MLPPQSCRDGISEAIVDGVAVQRVASHKLVGADVSDYQWCNTNNHRDTERYQSLEGPGFRQWYREQLDETSMERWAMPLAALCGERLTACRTLTIGASQQHRYFRPAAQVAFQGVSATRLLKDEAQDLASELEASLEEELVVPAQGWFVRTSACSPKDALEDGGAGPHHALLSVILALLASERIHKSMKDYSQDVVVYLMPFDETVTLQRELRVFVFEGQVAAMSQYDLFNASIFSEMSDEEQARVARCVDRFCRDHLNPRWAGIGGIASYVMDVECVPGHDADGEWQIRLVELNCFGAELAAGSALFHWVHDASELYSASRLCIRTRAAD